MTSRSVEAFDAKSLYENEYCARGEMESRIKEQQLCLFAHPTSAATMRANELRLWFSSIAYTLMNALRRLGLKNTSMAYGSLRYDPVEAAQNRCAGTYHLPQGVRVHVGELPLSSHLPTGLPHPSRHAPDFSPLLTAPSPAERF